MNTLDEGRQRIAELDRDILELIAARMQVARSIGERKKALGKPLRDWQIEKQVLHRTTAIASELGIDIEMARAVMHTIIDGCRVEQERLHYSSYGGSAQDILVVGGAGRMGRWFSRFFQDQGHRVWIYDPGAAVSVPGMVKELTTGLANASYVLISVPLEDTADVITEISSLGYQGTLFDIASLKGQLSSAIAGARGRGISVTSIHPLFGPHTHSLADKVICVCDCGDAEATDGVLRFLEGTAASIVRLSLEEHDRIMTYVLGLSHLINVLFTDVLSESGVSYEQLRMVGSTTFLSQMATTETVIKEDPGLYYAIQRCNPNTPELYGRLERAVAAVTGSVLAGNSDAFATQMRKCKEWVHNDVCTCAGVSITNTGKDSDCDS